MRSVRFVFVLSLNILLMLECGVSDSQVGAIVRTSVQNTMSTDPRFAQWGLTVTGVQVERLTDSTYQGTATIEYEGVSHSIPLHVTYDGKNVVWQTEPGAFSFVLQ